MSTERMVSTAHAIVTFMKQLDASPITSPRARSLPEEKRTSLGDFELAFRKQFEREWKAARLPAHIPRGPENRCWENALDLAIRTRSLSYVEGNEVLGGHAYCVDAAGVVVDNTWPENILLPEYFGVAFDPVAVLTAQIRFGRFSQGGLLKNVDYFYPWLIDDLAELLDPLCHRRPEKK